MSKIRVGDTVMVRSGKWRAKTGLVERVLPESNKAVVAGVNIIKKHQKKSASRPQGGIIERPAPLPLSKLMVVDAKTKRPTRIGYTMVGDKKTRLAKRGGSILEITTDKK